MNSAVEVRMGGIGATSGPDLQGSVSVPRLAVLDIAQSRATWASMRQME
jgi:hypothetical protein